MINGNMDSGSYELLEKVWNRKLSERGCSVNAGGPDISVYIDTALQTDEYFVQSGSEKIRISGGCTRSVFAGTGDFLRHCVFDGKGGFEPYTGELRHASEREEVAIYFASHYQNFYETGPIDAIEQVVEDIALQGGTDISAWYDMHQYEDIDTPESIQMIARLKRIFKHVKLCGMRVELDGIANEAFKNSPVELRADWLPQNGYHSRLNGHYNVEICPNKPGGMEEILKNKRKVYEAFRDIGLDAVCDLPYDQGGCTCAQCAPWGINGYLKTTEAVHELCREILPDTEQKLSLWKFDKFTTGELDGIYKILNSGRFSYIRKVSNYFDNDEETPEWFKRGDLPGNTKFSAFTEITMFGANPWGGYGANPYPRRLEETYKKRGGSYGLTKAYSEGIFEDLNKAVILALYTGRIKDLDEIITEYGRFEFCLNNSDAKKFAEMVRLMEDTLERTIYDQNGTMQYFLIDPYPYEGIRVVIKNPAPVKRILELATHLDSVIPEQLKTGYKWRVFLLRALIDSELVDHDMYLSPKFEDYSNELSEIYCADEASFTCTPLTRKAVTTMAKSRV